jgi:catecholate siderophore receptor
MAMTARKNAIIFQQSRPKTNLTLTMMPLGTLMMGGVLPASVMCAEAPPQLDAVVVKADAEKATPYQAASTRVGKIKQDPHDVPQALTSVTQKLIEEQKANTLKESLRNVAGLTFNAAEGGRSGDNMMLRGFYTYGDMYLDGIRDTAQYNREVFNLEQVDVLRGSAAMLFGRGQAGGVINQVSKTPSGKDQKSLEVDLGGYEHQEISGDFAKNWGDVGVRLNAMTRDESSWRVNPATGARPEMHRDGVAPSIAYRVSAKHTLLLNYLQVKTSDNPDYGVSFDNATKRPTERFSERDFWGIDANFDNSETKFTTLAHDYKITPHTDVRTQIRRSSYDRVYWASAPSASVAPDADGNSPKTRKMDTNNWTVQSDWVHRRSAWGIPHEIVTGLEYLDEDSKRWALQDLDNSDGVTSGQGNTRFYYSPNVVAGDATTYQGKSYAMYVQDNIEFLPHWSWVGGVRRDQLSAEYSSLTSPRLRFGEWSYRSGLSWKPTEEEHYYLSWSDSFSPTADLYQLSGSAYPAERSQVVELGGKWLWFEGDLAFRSALYHAQKVWERNNDLESTAAILTKKRRTLGLEFELAGRIMPAWEAFAGLALMNAKILEVAENRDANTGTVTHANPNFEGQRPRNTPPYTYTLWTTYRLGTDWKIGGGAEGKGKRFGYNPSRACGNDGCEPFDPNTIESYIRWDAMLAYEQTGYTMQLNVQNLFDKIYYDAIYDNGGFTVPGTARKFIVSLEAKF